MRLSATNGASSVSEGEFMVPCGEGTVRSGDTVAIPIPFVLALEAKQNLQIGQYSATIGGMGIAFNRRLPVPARPQVTGSPLVPEFDELGLCLLESMHAPDFLMEWSRHPYLKVITVLRGRGEFFSGNRVRPQIDVISPGRVGVVPAGVPHRIQDRPGESLHLYILCIGERFPFPARTVSAACRWITGPDVSGNLLRSLREIASLSATHAVGDSGKRGGSGGVLLRCGLVATVLGRLLSVPEAPRDVLPGSVARVRSFLARLPSEFFEDRGIDEAAAELGLSRRRFTQLFHELAGESYAARIRRLRLTRARRLLRESGLSPAAVAFECGYSDLSTFYRAFKKETGTSPAAWAKG